MTPADPVAAAGPPPALTDMSVQEMIDATPLGPILDQPVGEVLAGLGLPPLPQFPPMPPLPGLPPLPAIDVGMLLKPLTDLVGGFGTGNLSGADFDPSAIFEGLSTVLDTSMTMAQGALKLLDQLWVGQGSVAATAKTTEASANSAALSAQGSGMSFDIQAAAAIVGAGLATVQGIILATVAKIGALSVTLVTPPGQAAALGFATEGLAEATTAVAITRAQLLAPTTQMVTNGAPVQVANAPTSAAGAGQSPFAIAGSVLDTVSPALSTATQLPSMLAGQVGQMLSVNKTAETTALDDAKTAALSENPDLGGPGAGGGLPDGAEGLGGGGAGAAGLGGIGGAAAGLGMMSSPLGAARPSVPTIGATEPASYTPQSTSRAAVTGAAPMPAGMAPMAAAGAARGAGVADENHDVPDYLVTEDNGQQVVGEVPDVAPPVIGDDDPGEQPPAPAPDIELRLGGDSLRT